MTGTYIDISGGINYPLVREKVTLQIGSGLFYQIATKNIDSRRLSQSVRINGTTFNRNTITTSVINQNLGIRPFAALKIATGRFSHLRIQGGYQFNFYDESRIRFRQQRSTSRGNSTYTSTRVRLDDNLFDFKYNDQYINHLPFDSSGFFVNVGIMWSL